MPGSLASPLAVVGDDVGAPEAGCQGNGQIRTGIVQAAHKKNRRRVILASWGGKERFKRMPAGGEMWTTLFLLILLRHLHVRVLEHVLADPGRHDVGGHGG